MRGRRRAATLAAALLCALPAHAPAQAGPASAGSASVGSASVGFGPVPSPVSRAAPLRSGPAGIAAPRSAAGGSAPPLVLAQARGSGASRRGLCADWRLEGRLIEEIEGPGYCGVPLPVEITRAYGVEISPPARINCRTARALAEWLERGPVQDAPRLLGGHLEGLRLGGSYACRTRNFRGGRLSEHAAGNAVDVAGFRLEDGRRFGFARWRDGAEGEFLLRAWRAACGVFGTVLGPDHDAVHGDHFHLDTASRPEGPACR